MSDSNLPRTIGIAVALAFIGLACYFAIRTHVILPGLTVDLARFTHIEAFATAVAQFNRDEGRSPTSLDELVAKGLLPDRGQIYACPILRGTTYLPVLHYSEIEYDLNFQPEGVLIAVKQRSIEAWERRYGASFGARSPLTLFVSKGTTSP